jgi:hypothetical protein
VVEKGAVAMEEPHPDFAQLGEDLSALFPDLNLTGPDAGQRQLFLWGLMHTGRIWKACKIAKIGRTRSWVWRCEDPAFEQAADRCMRMASGTVADALWERAVEGVERGVWYRGEQVGTEREYSDVAAIFLLKNLDPERFRDRVSTEVGLSASLLAIHEQWRELREQEQQQEPRAPPPLNTPDVLDVKPEPTPQATDPQRPRPFPTWPRPTATPRPETPEDRRSAVFRSLDALNNAIPEDNDYLEVNPDE